MRYFTLLETGFFLLTTGLSHALPSPNSPISRGVPEIINFDERTVDPVLPAANTVGVEKGLFFNSFSIAALGNQATGLALRSNPNAAVTAAEQQDVTGASAITSLYSGSKVKSFDLKSFTFGCGANTAVALEDVATQCTIFVAGFNANQEKVSATYTFTPTVTNMAKAPVIDAILPSNFISLQNVTIVQDDPTLAALAVDDVSVVLYL